MGCGTFKHVPTAMRGSRWWTAERRVVRVKLPAMPHLPFPLPRPLRAVSLRRAWAVGALALALGACGRDIPPPPPGPPPEPEAPAGVWQGGAEGDGEGRVSASELRAAVALVNRRLPAAVDDVTRLDSIAVADRRLVYRYTAALDRSLDPSQRVLIDSGLAVLARRACNTVLARRAFDAGFDLRYEYRQMTGGAPEAAIDITKATCARAEDR